MMSRSSTIIEAPGTASPVRRLRTHPGEVLREEFMNRLGLSAHALALALRVPATRIGAIIREREPRAVTADTALSLARYFGNHAAVLAETADRLRSLARRNRPPGNAIERDVHPRAA